MEMLNLRKLTANEIVDRIENINARLDSMTIHQIHNSHEGQRLQEQLERYREHLKEAN
jgi:predicted ferric reductase